MRSILALLSFALGLLSAPLATAQTCSTSWINPSGGDWTTASNWSSGLPVSGSNVCINLPGTYTVTLSSTVSVTSLTLGTPSGSGTQTLVLSSTLTVSAASRIETTGRLDWQSGAIAGAGSLTNTGTMEMTTASKDVRALITNEATLTVSSPVRLMNGARLVNAATGTLTFTTDADVSQFNASRLVNEGTLVKAGTAGQTTIASEFENTGTLDVQTGTLRPTYITILNGGTYHAALGATLAFDGNTYVTGTLAGSPDGTVSFENDTFYANGGTTNAEAVLAFGGTGFRWLSGSFNALNGGAWRNDGLLLVGESNSHDLFGRLTNTATTRMTGSFRVLNGATFFNATGAMLTLDGAFVITQFNAATLANEGTLVKTGSGTVTVSSQFANHAGTVRVDDGRLRLTHTITLHDGTYDAAAGDSLVFDANVYAKGTLAGDPAGMILVEGGTFYSDTTETVLDFGGAGLLWGGATFNGRAGGTWRNVDLLVFREGQSRDVYALLTNDATLRADGGFRLVNGARLVNAATGTLTFTTDADVSQFNASRLVNEGTLVKAGTAGQTTIASEFENTGTLDVQTGTLRPTYITILAGGTYHAALGATLAFDGNTYVTGTLAGSPDGTVSFENDTFYANGGTTNAEAVLAFGGTGFRWLSGSFNAQNGGTWRNQGRLNIAGSNSHDVRVRLTNAATTHVTATFRLVNGARFVNAPGGRLELEGTLAVNQFNASTFVNEGLLVKMGGGVAAFNTRFENRSTGVIAGMDSIQTTPAVNTGFVAPGSSPGLLTLLGTLRMDSTSAGLDVEIGGTAPGSGYDQFRVTGVAALQGTLRARLANGFAPQAGDAFTVLAAPTITGGFERLEGLTDASAGISLYPSIRDTAVVLTAQTGVPTASGAFSVIPASTTNGTNVTVLLTGTGFAPDASIYLECDACSAPETFGTVPGRIQDMTPTTARVVFDLVNPFIAGAYDLVLEDPRGGRVSTPFTIGAGAGNLAIRAFVQGANASEKGPTPGVVVLEVSAPQAAPLSIPFTLGGTATQFQDYVINGTTTTATIPAGRFRTTISVLPLPDAVADDGETVEITLNPSGTYQITGPSSFTVTIDDGPVPTDFLLYSNSPRRAGNNGTVILNITGQAITAGATARLTGGGVNLSATVANVNDGGNFMNAMFDLTGVDAGTQLDLVVTNGTGETETIANAVTVEALVAPEIAVTLVGPNTFRSFLPPQRYQVMVTNRGNVDVMAVPVSVAVSKAGNGYLEPEFGVSFLDPSIFDNAPAGFPGWDRSKLIEDRGDGRLVMSVILPVVRAGETITLTVKARGYRIKAWTSPSARPLVPQRPQIVARSSRKGGNLTANMWTGLDPDALTMEVAAAVNSDALRNCLLTGLGSLIGATPVGCAAEVARSVAGFVGTLAGIASTPNAGARDGAVATVSLVGSMAAIIAECAFKSSPWGLGIAATVGVISTANACLPLLGEPTGDGQDNDDIRASDPNDKLGPSGVGAARYAAGIDAAGYLIRFENDSTATAPAILVNVTDPLDTSVYDLSTFALGPMSFGDTTITPPPGLQQWSTTVELPGETRFVVQILAGLNPETGIATWQLMAIDPQTGEFPSDATAGFLPPNVVKGEGEGSLFFTIHPKEGLASGTQICNEARIVFDVEDPIDTPAWCNTLDFVDPTSAMASLDEVQQDSTFTVAWSGSDATSGVSEYLVYVSTNDEPFEVWTVTPETSLEYPGRQDSTYAFYVVARDGAGNIEDKEEVAEVTTTVDVTLVATEDDALPTAFALEPNVPNPFHGVTRLRYALPEPADVRIEVFDALGRRVAVLADATQPAGWYAVDWDAAASLSSGLYFIRLHAGRFVEVRQATLVR